MPRQKLNSLAGSRSPESLPGRDHENLIASRLYIDCGRHLCVSYMLRRPSLGGGGHDEERVMASKQSDHLADVSGAAQLPRALRNGQTGQREPKENQVTQTIEEKN